MSLLSIDAVRCAMEVGGIVITPFNPSQLKSCSYDVRLGRYYFRRDAGDNGEYFNPYNQEEVLKHFKGPFEAQKASTIPDFDPTEPEWNGIDAEDRLIVFAPGELILGHTEEFIGGTRDPETGRCFTAEMKARSSTGRIGFKVCRCAGWGDVGYANRWTMEIKNDDPWLTFLVVGTRVAQIKFYELDPVPPEELYGASTSRDHYKAGNALEQIKASWRPEMLLPRLTKT